ncbi:peptidoglycan-binding protein [Amycolatopsis taiwanensis]|uniref:Peptidoglycan-binding protein n=1 Tax=Amycolatopsis taiwanensis TaxID=342230 RepID=A0A9W6QXX3_9PSEU|nr:peptidoglycan-binding protein [Amycolatopsis taiwanensis]GLY66049.1 peptidoglycan-binding protein [Amycolatopsis taiwanensis]
MSGTRRRRHRTGKVVLVAFGVLAVAAGVLAATGIGLPGGGPDPAAKEPPTAQATAQVTKQTMVDTKTENGSLSYGDTGTVKAALGGTVTRLPGPGSIVARGSALYKVDNKPVILLYGSMPAYRTLTVGAEGDDVKQFEENLAALGYTGFKVDKLFTDATATAVKAWQEDLGLDKTGQVEPGRIFYADGQIRVDDLKAAAGDMLQPGQELLTDSSTSQVVIVKLGMDDQRLAKKDATVTVDLPNGKSTPGKITDTRTVAESDSSGSGTGGSGDSAKTKIKVTVSVEDQSTLEGLDEASVEVAFTAGQRENVLTVPVSALLALSEGGYGLQIVDGTATRIVAIKTGMFARGRVEVSGDGLAEGMTVGVPS